MLQNIVIGQYIPVKSPLHRLDSRSKILALLLMAVIVFFANDAVTNSMLVGAIVIFVLLSRVPLKFFLKGMLPIFILIFFTFFLHAFFTNEGEVLFTFLGWSIYSGGLVQGFYIAVRIGSLVIIASLLTLTTSPIDLTDGFEAYLRPFKKIGVPSHEIALMMAISIRLIPTLLLEADRILKAQSARGADFTEGSLKTRLNTMTAFIIPLFVRSFKRAEDMATAMDARGYRGGEGRTKLRVLKWKLRDTIAIIIVITLGVLLWMARS
ncbi:transmembrane component of general energizing module of ECF transporters [Geomicrobium sp. JCM 19037]|uniref:energy-coupling factor transporter transmembrane component T family protein n=1 Tax=unclassified Geomicrobium TaxID=2628951 RepID=UPI00045F3647|nr:energy-coupling factor transporter transmembrane protein EcfT [Geomicrobium sp. JCM 19037]GAK04761.1 transmembrane component of general energizing module of ECF transporters [Geomicrobium sp. JCM 19037]